MPVNRLGSTLLSGDNVLALVDQLNKMAESQRKLAEVLTQIIPDLSPHDRARIIRACGDLSHRTDGVRAVIEHLFGQPCVVAGYRPQEADAYFEGNSNG